MNVRNDVVTVRVGEMNGHVALELATCAKRFYEKLSKDPNDRYRSWEHCYAAFSDAFGKMARDEAVDVDHLGLHLAFYLASWGMYRGSSFLLQQDYKVHVDAVKIMLNPDYADLRGADCEQVFAHKDKLKRLHDELEDCYKQIKLKVKNDDSISETLLTKVLMGTFGCVPAFDRYFVDGIKAFQLYRGTKCMENVGALADFYANYRSELEIVRESLFVSRDGRPPLPYPEMKLVDMMFWEYSFDKECKRKKEKEQQKKGVSHV